eukprot:TRINITY_DN2023_c0_g2_i1.p1 TRINITY_DN2023_c0_g2~~TRINITY_DN2023_c0_g2_i1.p1  ORF type:complete len:575 (+),score=120.12 TRINITY_DN2023_c0_g2_i1:55-1779(+)
MQLFMAAMWLQVMWLYALFLPAVSVTVDAGRKKGVDVNYVVEMVDKLKVFVQKQTRASKDYFDTEIQRLRGAVSTVAEGPDKKLLGDALKETEMERIEAEAASLEAMQYYHTVRAALGSQGGAPSCDFLTCGRHASCQVKDNGRAFCECAPCFKGDGFTCRPSACTANTLYTSQLISPDLPSSMKPEPLSVREINVAVLGQNRVAVVMRDGQQSNAGFLIVGDVRQKEIKWGDRQLFSGESKAFSPVIAGFSNGRLLISYRDADKHGVGYLISGQLDKTDPNGLSAALGVPHGFVKEQEQKTALVTLSTSRAICLYADHSRDEKDGTDRQSGGGAALVQVLADGMLSMLGKYHFAQGMPVQHIVATRLTESSFVVAFRGLPPNGADAGLMSKELSAVRMEVSKNNLLAIDPHELTLEDGRVDMLDRAVALVSNNLFSYAYYSRSEKETKMALIHYNPATRRMEQVGKPSTVSTGYNSFVNAISLPAGPNAPSTFTYVQPSGSHSLAQVCGVTTEGHLAGCKDVKWIEAELQSASAARLPDGRLLFAFVEKGGTPSTRFLSPEEASAQDISNTMV